MGFSRPASTMRERTYPPPFPDGWYRVALSSEVRRGKIRYLECLGQQMVVYRSDVDDSVHAMAAFCPHLGANLAGGCVKQGHVECPFHGWQMASDGRVAHIPYARRLPTRSLQATWPIREQYGQIFIYHRGGSTPDAAVPPPYEMPAIPDIDDGRLVFRGKHDAEVVHMHLLEFAENSVDFQHFGPLHGKMFVPWTRLQVPGIAIRHEAAWELDIDPARQHLAYFKNHAILKIFGRFVQSTRASALITFYGPAGVVTFRFTIPDLGEIVMFQTHLPLGPLEQKVDFHWFAAPKIPRLLVSYVIGNWVSQWRNDVVIWENKIHRPRPVLVQEDGPIHRLRRWFSQFYPDGSDARLTPQGDLAAAGD
ncbi:Rieske 2Fe-2S domain-containing protein [Nannocystis sp. ILAH1]|uniref:Rieske 2Fe-2S domain-containing protein n=1 Tax=unclassified Nannocystis TaxID=2627009 RepID=UPI00226EFF7B|nr:MULTISPECIES: Rieske 2Fe-2S domain-containing protein [unclassified Nannocystis]MCY0989580.1 Rieske 2Fe-2S domain-containing protein [Nannocystis sp. ILAH1]MCY1064801.1 Rieske 2Fe-2S domain-containing protein [Nannocystis sp. RBIL2]